MEGGIVEKRADGLGVFQTLSIYVKYPHASTADFLHFRRFFFRFRRALSATLLCFVSLVSLCGCPLSVVRCCPPYQRRLTSYFNYRLNTSISFIATYYILYTITFSFFLPIPSHYQQLFSIFILFPLSLSSILSFSYLYRPYTVQAVPRGFIYSQHNYQRLFLSRSYNSLRRAPAIIIIFSIDFLCMFSFCVSLFSYTSFCLLYTVSV